MGLRPWQFMKFAVVVFPGSNSDRDAWYTAGQVLAQQAELVWHKDTELVWRRCGHPAWRLRAWGLSAHRGHRALLANHGARSSRFAERGGPVLGICNGFQVLLEAGLLPGAMVRNRGIKFVSQHVHVRVEQTDTPFTAACAPGQVLELPIAHGEGNYFAEPDVVAAAGSESPGRCFAIPIEPGSRARRPTRTARSTTSLASAIATRNVVGLMPHPERACEASLGSADGRVIFQSIVNHFAERVCACLTRTSSIKPFSIGMGSSRRSTTGSASSWAAPRTSSSSDFFR